MYSTFHYNVFITVKSDKRGVLFSNFISASIEGIGLQLIARAIWLQAFTSLYEFIDNSAKCSVSPENDRPMAIHCRNAGLTCVTYNTTNKK